MAESKRAHGNLSEEMVSAVTLLGVSPNLVLSEIRSAHRRLARQHHPDVGGDPAKFRRIQEAYKLLAQASSKKTVGPILTRPKMTLADAYALLCVPPRPEDPFTPIPRGSRWSTIRTSYRKRYREGVNHWLLDQALELIRHENHRREREQRKAQKTRQRARKAASQESTGVED